MQNGVNGKMSVLALTLFAISAIFQMACLAALFAMSSGHARSLSDAMDRCDRLERELIDARKRCEELERKSPTPDAEPAPRPSLQMASDKPAERYPAPIVAGGTANGAAIPAAAELPKASADGIEWAWEGRRYRRGSVVVVPQSDGTLDGSPIFIVGDLHGDAASLRRVLSYVWAQDASATVVFLGDVADRSPGRDALECIRLFLWAAKGHPGKFLWLRGNHDALRWDDASRRFASDVRPCDFADYLNERAELADEGRAICDAMRNLPSAAMLGTTWLSHGGVLQEDDAGVKSFSGFAAMTETQIADLVWSRMRDVANKLPSRAHKGAEVGRRQAELFVEAVRRCEGIEIGHFVCAHQHESLNGFGYLPFTSKYNDGATCQCICSFTNRDSYDGVARPAVLRYDGERTPIPVLFE